MPCSSGEVSSFGALAKPSPPPSHRPMSGTSSITPTELETPSGDESGFLGDPLLDAYGGLMNGSCSGGEVDFERSELDSLVAPALPRRRRSRSRDRGRLEAGERERLGRSTDPLTRRLNRLVRSTDRLVRSTDGMPLAPLSLFFPAQLPTVGQMCRDALVQRQSHGGDLAVASLVSDGLSFEDARRIIEQRVYQEIRGGASFYIGITENPTRRCEEHGAAWDRMVLLLEAPSSRISADMERMLLSTFGGRFQCCNASAGGERPSAGSPHYTYLLLRDSGLLRRSR